MVICMRNFLPKCRELNRILLLDAPGLSHYTSYFAFGLSKHNNVILHAFSKTELLDIGADTMPRIDFHQIGRSLFTGHSMFSLLTRPVYIFIYLLKILVKSNYDVVHVQGHLPMFFAFVPLLRLMGKDYFWTVPMI